MARKYAYLEIFSRSWIVDEDVRRSYSSIKNTCGIYHGEGLTDSLGYGSFVVRTFTI